MQASPADPRIPPNIKILVFWLLAFGLGVRLVHVGAPPVGMHSWRQADTAAMARNFHENGYRFAFPEVDWGGAGPGYVECELPLFPFTVALAYAADGVHEWIGRLGAAAAFLVGAATLFRLVLSTSGAVTAAWSLAFYLFLPLNVFYSRAIMPESWMITSSILGVYWFHLWTEHQRVRDLALSALFVSLAALLKLPALYLGLLLAWMAWDRFGPAMFRTRLLWAYAAATLGVVGAWYYHAHSIRLDGGLTFGIWEYGKDKWGNWELVATWKFWNGLLFRSIAERWLTWAGFPVFLVGLALRRGSARERMFDAWLIAVVVYFIVVARGNFVHEYYQLPLAPIAAFYMGKVFASAWSIRSSLAARAALVVLLIGIAALSAWRYVDYLRREDPGSKEVVMGRAIRNLTPPRALVITAQGGNPTLLYLGHRKGWSIPEADVTPEFVARARSQGARYLAGTGEAPRSLASPGMPTSTILLDGPQGYLVRLD